MALIGAIADDLTGATTVGVLLARAGVKTAAFFKGDTLGSDDIKLDHQAIIVSTDSRHSPKEEAMQKVRAATVALKKMGVKQFSKRTDTTLRGGIGAEIDAMLEELGADAVAVMVPAMPQSNRIVVGGYSIINGVPLSKTPVANDVRTPIRDSFVPRLIGNQTQHKVAHISLDEILQGKENLKKAFSEEKETGARLFIVDATSLEEVELIAQAVVELNWDVLAVDPGPFTERLAQVKGWVIEERDNLPRVNLEPDSPDDIGTVLVVAGSASSVTATQMGVLKEVPGTHAISVKAPLLLVGGECADKEISGVAKQVAEVLSRDNCPRVVLLETAVTGQVLNLEEEERKYGLVSGEGANNINSGLGKIVNEILEEVSDKIVGLYTTGGDIMVNVCKTIGVNGIELIDYVIPQADLGRLIGSKFNGLPVVGKGGLTGQDDTAVKCVERLFKESLRL